MARNRKGGDVASSPLQIYFRDVDGTPLLTKVEEQELGRRIQEGDLAARDHLVRANLRFVVRIARDFSGRGLTMADRIQAGNLGLLRAAESFDQSLGTRFTTYASNWISQAILIAIDVAVPTVRVPAYMVDLVTKWRRMAVKLREELGRDPTREEITRRMRLSKSQAVALGQALVFCGSAGVGEGELSMATLPDNEAKEAGLDEEDLRQLELGLRGLNKREAEVLRLRHGLTSAGPLTLAQVSERLGIGRELVRQLERKALESLRRKLGVSPPAPTPRNPTKLRKTD